MTEYMTTRFELPLLATGQAHKETFHNEAIAKLDMIAFPLVQNIENDPDTLSPLLGQSWIIGPTPVAEWANYSSYLASWTGNGWRFINPVEKMRVNLELDDSSLVFRESEWRQPPSVERPAGGSVIDIEARAAIDSISNAIQQAGIMTYNSE